MGYARATKTTDFGALERYAPNPSYSCALYGGTTCGNISHRNGWASCLLRLQSPTAKRGEDKRSCFCGAFQHAILGFCPIAEFYVMMHLLKKVTFGFCVATILSGCFLSANRILIPSNILDGKQDGLFIFIGEDGIASQSSYLPRDIERSQSARNISFRDGIIYTDNQKHFYEPLGFGNNYERYAVATSFNDDTYTYGVLRTDNEFSYFNIIYITEFDCNKLNAFFETSIGLMPVETNLFTKGNAMGCKPKSRASLLSSLRHLDDIVGDIDNTSSSSTIEGSVLTILSGGRVVQ